MARSTGHRPPPWARSVARVLAVLLASWPATSLADTPEDRLETTFGTQQDFLWGAATAAYQIEGAWDRDGRQKSIWDVFSQTAGKIHNNDNGNVADKFYELYPGDVQRVADYGFNSFRYSISWTRIFTRGPDGVHRANPKGVEFYKNVTSLLLAKGITPLVTMFHWDLPADLDWLNPTVVDAFVEYADFLFRTFPEVKHWLTFNEPLTFCELGYGAGVFAPGVKSDFKQYTCGHYVLLAHARAVALYREKYHRSSGGQISITLNYDWGFPYDESSPADREAAQLHHDFSLGWFADPVYLTGDYPRSMRERLGANLPSFTREEQNLLRGSYIGFYGLNTYSGAYIRADKSNIRGFVGTSRGKDGKDIGPVAASGWLRIVPTAIRAQLEYLHARYRPPAIIITENGVDVPGENETALPQVLDDTFRIEYYQAYMDQVAAAVRESGVPVKGYFAWSLLDNFEWADGYSCRFGLTYVDYTTQKRYPKRSAQWFTALMDRMRRARDAHVETQIVDALGRNKDFLWGAATAAYQVEGAWNIGGRQQSIWDTFSHTPGKTLRGDTGDVAVDFYHLCEGDIQRLADYGFNAFRFSVAWPRVFPRGADGTHRPNPEGIQFYRNIFAALRARDITPLVTMFHWDLPDELDWLNASVVDAFATYADFLFQTFPEVKYWMTFNEPWSFCELGYGIGVHAPGIRSDFKQYLCGHHVLLAHARAVDIYRRKYMWAASGNIAMVINCDFGFPLNASDPADVAATQLYHDFFLGWFADPVYLTGDYPESMKQRLGAHLPAFSEAEKALLRNSYEGFYGLNTYAGKYVAADASSARGFRTTYQGLDGTPIGPMADSDWLYVVPRAIRAHLEYVAERYRPPAIVVTENGVDAPGEDGLPLGVALQDTFRVNFYRDYLAEVARAANSGVPVAGYVAWSLLDNFEWADGYSRRFGITYVDYATQKRYPKQSAKWFTALLHRIHGGARGPGARGRDMSWLWWFLAVAGSFALVASLLVWVLQPRSQGELRASKSREPASPAASAGASGSVPSTSRAASPLLTEGNRLGSPASPAVARVPVQASAIQLVQYQVAATPVPVARPPSYVQFVGPPSAAPRLTA